MKVIIPAKACSERVHDKNWRPFIDDFSLVDITITKLIAAGFNSQDIIVSSECENRLQAAVKRHGIVPMLRDLAMCCNDLSLCTWIRSTVEQAGIEGDVAWAQVTNPAFTQYAHCVSTWESVRHFADSLVVAYPVKRYLMMEAGSWMRPIGWSFGEHHTKSQQLPMMYEMPFTFSILSQESIERSGYHIGLRPHWFVADGKCIDIDTEDDYRAAQAYYSATH